MSAIQIVGHRGAKDEAPENTLAGFEHARSIGLHAVEFDVHLSADHELVVVHDKTIDRTTNANGPVADFTAAELAALDARATCPDWPAAVGVPTLAQVLDSVASFTRIQVEIKRDTPERLEEVVTGALRQLEERDLGSRAVITSFEETAIDIARRLAPNQQRAFIGRPTDPDVVNTAMQLGADVMFHRFREHPADRIQQAHHAGLGVGGGPCDSIEELRAAIELGLGEVTSDAPSLLLRQLRMM